MVREFLEVHTRPRLAYALRCVCFYYCSTYGVEVTESSTNKQHLLGVVVVFRVLVIVLGKGGV